MAPPVKPAPPQNQALDINLRQVAKSGLYNPQFVAKMIAFDVNGDGHLKGDDLAKFFGNSPESTLKDLYESIQNKDYDKFLFTITSMGEYRNARFANSVRSLYDQIEKFGIKEGRPFNLRDSEGTSDHKAVRDEVAKILAQKLSETYTKEFGEVPDQEKQEELAKALAGALFSTPFASLPEVVADVLGEDMFNRHPLSIQDGMAILFGSFSKQHQDMLESVEFSALKVYSNYLHSGLITRLEKQFGITILINQSHETERITVSRHEVQILRGALTFIQAHRPADLKLLKRLDLTLIPNREGAQAIPENGSIFWRGPFGKPMIDAKPPGWYSTEFQSSLRHDQSSKFILGLLIHELGHLVSDRDKTGYAKHDQYSTPDDYQRLAPGDWVSEWFAEDYSIYMQSNGKRIMTTTIAGQIVPNYDARLAYFRKHYPLANTSKK